MRSRADVIFKRAKIAIFIDGCFWHGCPEHATWPASNAAWWRTKIETNRLRDARVTNLLQEAGWSVVRIWEHEIEEAAASAAEDIRRRQRRGSR
jgi:DNA mismatch endonuclease, patch repair protein